jgi:hypothetical protein
MQEQQIVNYLGRLRPVFGNQLLDLCDLLGELLFRLFELEARIALLPPVPEALPEMPPLSAPGIRV